MATFGATSLTSVQADTGWIKTENLEEAHPLGGGTVLSSFGFQAAIRQWRGICTTAVHDLIQTQYEARTVATLTDDDSASRSARILSQPEWERVRGTVGFWRYTIIWVDRT